MKNVLVLELMIAATGIVGCGQYATYRYTVAIRTPPLPPSAGSIPGASGRQSLKPTFASRGRTA